MQKKYDFSGWLFEYTRRFRVNLDTRILSHIFNLGCRIKGVNVGKKVHFLGYPVIYRTPHSQISIGDQCRFNSSRRSVRMVLYKRCIFTTQETGAEISIGNNSGGTGLTVAACSSITIGNNVLMGAYCTIVDNDFHNPDPNKREGRDFSARPIVIEDNVFIGMNSMILKGVRIGKNAVIGANSVVLTNIPENAIAMGNPCKVIIKRNWGTPEKTEENPDKK